MKILLQNYPESIKNRSWIFLISDLKEFLINLFNNENT